MITAIPNEILEREYTEVSPGLYKNNLWLALWEAFEAETGKTYEWYRDRMGELLDERLGLAGHSPEALAAFGLT